VLQQVSKVYRQTVVFHERCRTRRNHKENNSNYYTFLSPKHSNSQLPSFHLSSFPPPSSSVLPSYSVQPSQPSLCSCLSFLPAVAGKQTSRVGRWIGTRLSACRVQCWDQSQMLAWMPATGSESVGTSTYKLTGSVSTVITKYDTGKHLQTHNKIYETRLNAFTRSCLFNATSLAAQCHSQQTNSDSLARRHHQVRNV